MDGGAQTIADANFLYIKLFWFGGRSSAKLCKLLACCVLYSCEPAWLCLIGLSSSRRNPAMLLTQESNKKSLEAAVDTAAEFLNSKGKCAIVAGVKVRSCHAEDALLNFANATDYPVTGASL